MIGLGFVRNIYVKGQKMTLHKTKTKDELEIWLGKMYCRLCARAGKRYNVLTYWCSILKMRIKCPEESHCSWFIPIKIKEENEIKI